MNVENKYLGIDVGSVAISIVILNDKKEIIDTAYDFHEGKIADKLIELLSPFNLKNIRGIATTSSTPSYIKSSAVYDSRVTYITASKSMHKKVGSILIVGGERFGLVLFDDKQQYRTFKGNSSCAAGTGSFLDQQAKRLNLDSISSFSDLANQNHGDFPKIASRCSVFAKTDLIHAQQEGYSLSEICDGLCHGLAKNIVDTLFNAGNIASPMIFTGGVSLNVAVARHIENLTGIKPVVGEHSHLYGAIGAAIHLIDDKKGKLSFDFKVPGDILLEDKKERSYFYKPLKLELSEYPDFIAFDKYNLESKIVKHVTEVEVDIYTEIKNREYDVFMGIDIGSTSTKALLLNENKDVLAGFYTRTSGQPVNAVRAIFETIQDIISKTNCQLNILGVGTTGSGRKFIGKIIGADIIPDEITAHARAAIELDAEVDTIIEIGGQDAKFTTLSNGRVTFSIMNNVCAAGTGSFIEEQAKKLGVSLDDYSEKAMNTIAPIASDRCTVFMERDLNHYLNENYTTNEILASVLHSVRENYLLKVAIEKNIGNKIFFQGATAKNQALVAAFEQKLNKPILVSKYCHLTGALGVALELSDKKINQTKFRGIKLYKNEIPVQTEICDICTNHCKYKIAEVEGEKEAYGFLCGRDYNSTSFVDNNTSDFNLAKEYNKHFRFKALNKGESKIAIGIPAGLYLFEDLLLWQRFFDLLNIKTVTSANFRDAVKTGKRISGAEFCSPMNAIQGHVKYLLDKADYIFLPTYLEERQKSKSLRRQYCYYSQFAPPVVASIDEIAEQNKIINPILFSLQNEVLLKNELFNSLKKAGFTGINLISISNAFNKAKREKEEKLNSWKAKFQTKSSTDSNLKVILLGRPYTVLTPVMNNNIPDIFAKKGVKTFYQNMLKVNENEIDSISEILSSTKWKFASAILTAADYVARKKDLYPVLISSFKCSPDSFTIEYFKQIMDFYKKPYLILQLDEYNSNVGYETRIEAALRSFQNHYHSIETVKSNSAKSTNNLITDAAELKGKILLMPSLGEYASKLLEANLRRIGIEAHTLFDSEDSIKRSLNSNTGQCLPLNIILQDAFDYIEKNNLDPANTVLWMIESPISCNLGMFINYMAKLLREQKEEFQQLRIYCGQITFADISINTSINSYLAFLFGGFLRKIECKLRPYEIQKGQTDILIKKSMELLYQTFMDGSSKEEALKQVITWSKTIKTKKQHRPKVAIFGDLYVRDNDVFNQNLIRFIEKNGGEAITTPYSEYIKIIAFASNNRLIKEGFYMKASLRRFLIAVATQLEERYLNLFNEILHEPISKPLKSYNDKLKKLNLTTSYNGESFENALKIIHLIEYYPDIALFVQTNPSYCCPSLVTQAMKSKMEKITGIPIVTIEYDGTSSSKNEDIIPFLTYANAAK
ncbi:acyl-CoA dehydratase activase [Maribellus sediminis]|uniref:acyl-CoA dehydratase activase n=1 Tax=Maribellus sediminis TaxID=2696285 RepID=UPI001431EF47|nr:acyl-CoA dehydratase activase [Maribellus sediminis]